MALRYTTVKEFWEWLGINESTGDFQAADGPQRETVAAKTVSAGTYYLDQQGVNEDTLVLYVGDSATALTITDDYTFNSDTSAVTITSDGATALGSSDLKAVYDYNSLGKEMSYNKSVALLERMETKLDSQCNTTFADSTATDPGYNKITNELHDGKGSAYVNYNTVNYPIAKLQTTVNGAYTTGGTEITLTDASSFPSSGTIYIGGNKVVYTAKATNVLTIPSSTPSIDDGATVRGEVVEISTAASGTTPSYIVITPASDYGIDYDTGRIQLQNESYFDSSTIDNLDKPGYGVANRFRVSYMQAWHEPGQDPTIPDEIEETIYMMASLRLVHRTILKSNAGQRDNFSPSALNSSKEEIDEAIGRYRMIRSANI